MKKIRKEAAEDVRELDMKQRLKELGLDMDDDDVERLIASMGSMASVVSETGQQRTLTGESVSVCAPSLLYGSLALSLSLSSLISVPCVCVTRE